jgi:hypothetical protein
LASARYACAIDAVFISRAPGFLRWPEIQNYEPEAIPHWLLFLARAQFVAQQFHLGSERRLQLGEAAGDVAAGMDHGEKKNRFGLHIADQEVLVDPVEPQVRMKVGFGRQQVGLLLEANEGLLQIGQVSGGRRLAPLVNGEGFDLGDIPQGALREEELRAGARLVTSAIIDMRFARAGMRCAVRDGMSSYARPSSCGQQSPPVPS